MSLPSVLQLSCQVLFCACHDPLPWERFAVLRVGPGPSAGSGVLQLVQSLLVLRLRCLLELVVRLLPLLCLACLACLVLCSGRWISYLVGVGVARPVVGSTGETCHRWRFPSPVASSRRPGSSTGLPRFFEVLDQVFLRWRRLSVVLPAATVDCCLSSLRAGVCSLLWQWRIFAQVLMVACLPLLRVRGSAPSPVPWMLIASTGFRSMMAYSRLDFG